jgi:hypothetical protein
VSVGAGDPRLREELLAMGAEDLRVRERLAGDGSLFEGYHPRMEEVHRRNAARLREIIGARGWPGTAMVGEDGAEAAWLIVQHAIGEPGFMRSAFALVSDAVRRGDAPAWQLAYLEDRIRVLEGRPQRYATQFDVGEDGMPIPAEIEEPDRVDERRASMGLEPLAERLARVEREPPLDESTRARKERERLAWLERAGWRA